MDLVRVEWPDGTQRLIAGVAADQVLTVFECPADADGDGNVGITDLLVLLSTWGPCP